MALGGQGSTSATECFFSYSTSSKINRGLFDHITSTECQFETWGGDTINGAHGNYAWSASDPRGTVNEVYFEDSTFTNHDPASTNFNCWDAHNGGSYVVRFSSLDGCRLEAHGVQADDERGTRKWENYYDTLANTGVSQAYRPWLMRAGQGFVFHNTVSNFIHNDLYIDSPRESECDIATVTATCPSGQNQVPVWKMCNGLNAVDGNQSGQHGYPCLDGLGVGGDNAFWTGYWGAAPPGQYTAPAYLWKNTVSGSEDTYTINCSPGNGLDPQTGGDFCTNTTTYLLLQNRDFYTYNASCVGGGACTSGVGEGSSLPTTCTTGTGFWNTSAGSWNTSASNPNGVQASGADGVLYQCVSTNTWSAYYTPYTYPHPLQGGGGSSTTNGFLGAHAQ